jgi:hypothetical protein
VRRRRDEVSSHGGRRIIYDERFGEVIGMFPGMDYDNEIAMKEDAAMKENATNDDGIVETIEDEEGGEEGGDEEEDEEGGEEGGDEEEYEEGEDVDERPEFVVSAERSFRSFVEAGNAHSKIIDPVPVSAVPAVPAAAHDSMAIDDPSSTTCDEADDDETMSIGTVLRDELTASGEDGMATAGRNECDDSEDNDDDDAVDDEEFWLAASGKIEDGGYVVENQPLGGPKYYVLSITNLGKARIVHEAMPSDMIGDAHYNRNHGHRGGGVGGGRVMEVTEERGYEVIEYNLLENTTAEEVGTRRGKVLPGRVDEQDDYDDGGGCFACDIGGIRSRTNDRDRTIDGGVVACVSTDHRSQIRRNVTYDRLLPRKDIVDITDWENRYVYRKIGGGQGWGQGEGGGDVVSVISDCTYGSTSDDMSSAEYTGMTADSSWFTVDTRWNRDYARYGCCHPVVFD